MTLTAGGSPKTTSVALVGGLNQIIIIPRQAPPVGTPITLTISKAVKDMQGNALATPFNAGFQIVEASEHKLYLPLVKKN